MNGRTVKGGYPASGKTAAHLKTPPPSVTRAAGDEHEIIWGNYRGDPDTLSGNPGSAEPPSRRPKLLRPDGEPFHPDPPFGFTKEHP